MKQEDDLMLWNLVKYNIYYFIFVDADIILKEKKTFYVVAL